MQVGSVLQAIVASVKPYGIFVRLRGFRANGLVHLSQVKPHLHSSLSLDLSYS